MEWRAEAGDVSRGELSGRPEWMRHAGQENRKRKLRPRTRRGAQWGRRGRLGPEPRQVRGVASAGSVKGRGELERKGETRQPEGMKDEAPARKVGGGGGGCHSRSPAHSAAITVPEAASPAGRRHPP